MNRSVLSVLALSVALGSYAQLAMLSVDSLVDRPDRWENHISVDASIDYNANSLYNELPYGLWRGIYLDRDLRERSNDVLRERNSAGYIIGGSIAWTGKPGTLGLGQRWRPLSRLAHHDEMGVRFTGDVYRMAFFGNAQFEGERADLGPSAYTWMRYQSAGVGLEHARSGSFIRLDVLLGQSLYSTDVEWAGIYTAEDGRVIRASLLGEVLVSDTAGSELGRNNGMGASISGCYRVRPRTMPGTRFSVGIDDLGFIRWNDQAMRLTKDTVIEFAGWAVDNILDLGDVLVGQEQLTDSLGFRFQAGSFFTPTPFRLHASVEHSLRNGWTIAVDVVQRYLPGFVPQLTVSASRRMSARALVGADLSYGGFGVLRLGLAGRVRIGEQLWATIGTPHVPGFFMGTMRGWGVSGGMAMSF